jgi:phosphoglycolate phosphatase-like HAD superfamily hydrolase
MIGSDPLTGAATVALIRSKRLVFWDFDGVIKDSVDVKTRAFEALFLQFGTDLAVRARAHHEANGGLSRFHKIPLYLDWAGLTPSQELIDEFCWRFSELALQGVIDSPWVTGVPEYLKANYRGQRFVLVTATPQNEIEHIVCMLGIDGYFGEIHGAPTSKSEAIASVLRRHGGDRSETLMIGDSDLDLKAARANAIPFLLRRTDLNRDLQDSYVGPMFEGLMP